MITVGDLKLLLRSELITYNPDSAYEFQGATAVDEDGQFRWVFRLPGGMWQFEQPHRPGSAFMVARISDPF